MTPRRRDDRGVVLPTRLMVLSISAVALAGVAFAATAGSNHDNARANIVVDTPRPSATPTTAPATTPMLKAKPKPVVKRKDVYVVVFNNSGIHGLAASVATKASSVGWNVVGSDNWYGKIDASTVYYPPRLQAAAKVLARDLGIQRLRPAIQPMQFDRLTVILTSDYR